MSRLEEFIKERFTSPDFRYQIEYTGYAGHAIELSKSAVSKGTDCIVAVGGDGTVNEIARGIIGTECLLGIIPTGSGNGLARHLKLPFSLKKALNCIANGRFIRIDSATLDDKLFPQHGRDGI